jgi:hypothetical protein
VESGLRCQLRAMPRTVTLKCMERLAILVRAELPRALAYLGGRGTLHEPDIDDRSIIWIQEKAEAEPAAKFLRGQGITAVHWPWH